MSEPLRCIWDWPHDPHPWDFGSGEVFDCDGWPEDARKPPAPEGTGGK